ncbi:M60 family metallopeptidase [Streptomyces sp. NPDC003038]|uniref:M60 family metallopeptidase n=1 Tax=unclassified Streptomyces TaxID=2593676 RepID=UPI0033A661D8
MPVPLYRQGMTTQAQWAAMLDASTVPLVEHAGRRVILTGLLPYVRRHQDEDQEALLALYEEIIGAQDGISGLDAQSKAGATPPVSSGQWSSPPGARPIRTPRTSAPPCLWKAMAAAPTAWTG